MRKLPLLALLFCSPAAFSQVAEIGVHGGVSRLSGKEIGQLNTGEQLSLDDGWRLGFRLTLNNSRFFGHEFFYAYNRSQLVYPDFKQGMAIHQGGYNFLVYALPEGSPVRPFVTGGGHFSNFVPPGSSAAQGGGDTNFGFNYGGGIKVRVSPIFLIRFDVRQYQTGKPFDLPGADGRLRQLEVSAGFSLAL
ncbi:MAG: outer membrane beta-barrel protein [Bryobacteraceae bacterium]|nr:outer membrane beta-barrel protein [Bryobacteraceae bacterium]